VVRVLRCLRDGVQLGRSRRKGLQKRILQVVDWAVQGLRQVRQQDCIRHIDEQRKWQLRGLDPTGSRHRVRLFGASDAGDSADSGNGIVGVVHQGLDEHSVGYAVHRNGRQWQDAAGQRYPQEF